MLSLSIEIKRTKLSKLQYMIDFDQVARDLSTRDTHTVTYRLQINVIYI